MVNAPFFFYLKNDIIGGEKILFSEEFLMDLGIATLGAGIVGAIAVLFGVLKGWQPLLPRHNLHTQIAASKSKLFGSRVATWREQVYADKKLAA